MKAYCDICQKNINLIINYEPREFELVNGDKISILAKVAKCSKCGEEIEIPEIHIENLDNAMNSYYVMKKEKDDCI